ncbi:hypothetical protein H0H92_007730 [Tricholoma furcatifolium]|nr:hypothetical protein H0H92_007730 [Tricholoma furcatifolium]
MSDLDEIFKSKFKYAFTTSREYTTRYPSIHLVPLSDESLGVHKATSGTTHQLVTPPKPIEEPSGSLKPPEEAWEALYPKGSINPGSETPGGFSFYLSGPPQFVEELEGGAREVFFGYRMMLQSEWEWVKGGKLPGVSLLSVPPKSWSNSDFGFSVGRGSYRIAVGRWVSISLRVKLNTQDEHNGARTI